MPLNENQRARVQQAISIKAREVGANILDGPQLLRLLLDNWDLLTNPGAVQRDYIRLQRRTQLQAERAQAAARVQTIDDEIAGLD